MSFRKGPPWSTQPNRVLPPLPARPTRLTGSRLPQRAPQPGAGGKARIALIGTGGRSEMYIRAIFGKHADTAELVAFSDVNPGRVEFYQKLIQELGAPGPGGLLRSRQTSPPSSRPTTSTASW